MQNLNWKSMLNHVNLRIKYMKYLQSFQLSDLILSTIQKVQTQLRNTLPKTQNLKKYSLHHAEQGRSPQPSLSDNFKYTSHIKEEHHNAYNQFKQLNTHPNNFRITDWIHLKRRKSEIPLVFLTCTHNPQARWTQGLKMQIIRRFILKKIHYERITCQSQAAAENSVLEKEEFWSLDSFTFPTREEKF